MIVHSIKKGNQIKYKSLIFQQLNIKYMIQKLE